MLKISHKMENFKNLSRKTRNLDPQVFPNKCYQFIVLTMNKEDRGNNTSGQKENRNTPGTAGGPGGRDQTLAVKSRKIA